MLRQRGGIAAGGGQASSLIPEQADMPPRRPLVVCIGRGLPGPTSSSARRNFAKQPPRDGMQACQLI
jgi:hypothetical protein